MSSLMLQFNFKSMTVTPDPSRTARRADQRSESAVLRSDGIGGLRFANPPYGPGFRVRAKSAPRNDKSGKSWRRPKPPDRADDEDDEEHQHDALQNRERRFARRHARRQRMQRADFQKA